MKQRARKWMAFALTAVTVLNPVGGATGSNVAEAASTNTNTEDSLVVTSYRSTFTTAETLSSSADVTYTFYNQSTGNFNWHNYVVELWGNDVYVDVRADSYGWNGDKDNGVDGAVFNYDGAPSDWDAWLDTMSRGAYVTVRIQRNETSLTITTTAAGATCTYSAVVPSFGSNDISVALTGEYVNLSDITFHDNTDTASTKTASMRLLSVPQYVKAETSAAYAATGGSITVTVEPQDGYAFTTAPSVTVSGAAVSGSAVAADDGGYTYTLKDITGDTDITVSDVSLETGADTSVGSNGTLADINCNGISWNNDNNAYEHSGWWKAHTAGLKVKNGTKITVSFTNTTYDYASVNWNCPVFVVYGGNDGIVNGVGYTEYFVGRGDLYGWDSADGNTANGLNIGSYTVNSSPDWDAFLSTLKAGTKGTITAKMTKNILTVTISIAGAVSTYTYSTGGGDIYISLSGELCTLSDISYKVTSYNPATYSSSTTTDSTSGSTTDTSNDEETEDGGTQGDLDCDVWWTAHTAGVEVAEGTTVTYTFTNTTDSDVTNNWDCPVYVVYTGNEGIVNGSGYTEYFVARADLYGWDATGANTNDGLQYGTWTVNSEPDWDTWVSKLKAGVSCTLTASMSDKVLTVTMDVNGAKSTWVYKTNGSTIYISLTGEYTVLSDISYTVKATGSSDSSADDTNKSDDTQDSDSTDSTDNSSDSSSDASGSDSTGSDSSSGSDASTGSDSSSSSSSTTEVSKGDTVTDSSSKGVYTVTSTGKNTVAYAGPASDSKTSVTIPATITVDGVTYKVTSIDKNAFSGNTSVKKVTIGKNIKTIGKKAFKGCSSLKKITIKTKSLKAKNVGANAFKGISKKATVKVPSGKKASYKKILTKKGASKKITVK